MLKKITSKSLRNQPEEEPNHTSDMSIEMGPSEDPILESLQNDIYQIGEHLQEIAHKVLDEGISEYPVFVASQEIADIGKPVFDRDTIQLNWFYYASLLEEFVKKNLVLPENLSQFKRIYSDPRKIACIFVISNTEDARFVFVPYIMEEASSTEEESSTS